MTRGKSSEVMNAKSAWFVRWCLLYVIGGKEKECFVICRVFDFDKMGIEWDSRDWHVAGLSAKFKHNCNSYMHRLARYVWERDYDGVWDANWRDPPTPSTQRL